jgi:hypothetical protein
LRYATKLPKVDLSLLRKAQPYLVSVRKRVIESGPAAALFEELAGGIYLWNGTYHSVKGLIPDSRIQPVNLFVG